MSTAPNPALISMRLLTPEEVEILEGDMVPPGLTLNPDYRLAWWISPMLRGVADPANYEPYAILRPPDGVVIGRLSIEPRLDPPVIAMVEICDRLQGQGFGRAAIAAALDLLRARRAKRVRATILTGNSRSEAAFSACGFVRTDENAGQVWEWRG